MANEQLDNAVRFEFEQIEGKIERLTTDLESLREQMRGMLTVIEAMGEDQSAAAVVKKVEDLDRRSKWAIDQDFHAKIKWLTDLVKEGPHGAVLDRLAAVEEKVRALTPEEEDDTPEPNN